MTVELSEVERRMQPGAWFTNGFLQQNASLAQVLQKDSNMLNVLGVTAEQVGTRLAELIESSAKSDWFSPFRTGNYKVEIRRRRGFITCPWAPEEFEPCVVGQGSQPTANEFVIRYKGLRLEGFELSVHLIRDHSFFGGPGSRIRIEPEQAVKVLGLGR